MRKLLTLWIALAAVLSVNASSFAQVGQIPAYLQPAPSGGCSDTNATAWAAAVVTAGGTVSGGQLTAVCNLITAYKSHGVYSLLDEEWLYASENAFTAMVSIVAPYHSHAVVGSPTFTANLGYGGGSSSNYINTGYHVASVNHLTGTGGSWGVYIDVSRTSTNNNHVAGVSDGTTYLNLDPLNVASSFYFDWFSAGFFTGTRSPSNAKGNFIINRVSGSTSDVYIGAAAAQSFSIGSVGNSGMGNFYVLVYNNNGTPTASSGDTVGSVFLGLTMTATQAGNKNADLCTYMTARGATGC